MGLSKTHYAHHISTLMSVSCFAGLFSFTILLLLPHPACTPTAARISTLLTQTTPIFLSAVLLSLMLNLLLHPLADSDTVLGVRRIVMRLGLCLLYLYLGSGLVLFALAVQVVQVREPSLGWLGVAAVGSVCVGIVGMGAKGERERGKGGGVKAVTMVVIGDLKRPRALLMLVVFVIQAGILIALLGIGGTAVVRGEVDAGCKSGGATDGLGNAIWTKERPLPVDIVVGRVDTVQVVVTVTEIRIDPTGGTASSVVATSTTIRDQMTMESIHKSTLVTVTEWTTTTTQETDVVSETVILIPNDPFQGFSKRAAGY